MFLPFDAVRRVAFGLHLPVQAPLFFGFSLAWRPPKFLTLHWRATPSTNNFLQAEKTLKATLLVDDVF